MRKSRSIIICSLIIVMLAAVIFSACNRKKVTVSFSWWGKDIRNEYTLEGIRLFEEQHDNITIEPYYDNFDGFHEAYRNHMADGTAADVMQINFDWLLEYSRDGKGFYDLNQLDDYLDLNGYKTVELNVGTMNGHLNGIPVAFNTSVFFYNKTVFEEYGILGVPQTWDEIFDAARIMDGRVYPLMMTPKNLYFVSVAYTEQQTGKPLFDDQAGMNFDQEDIELLLSTAVSFIEQKVTLPDMTYSKDYVTSGEVAGYIAWITEADYMCDEAIEKGYDIVPGDFPGAYLYDRSGYYLKPAELYVISKNTRHPREAAEFLDYLINDPYFASIQNVERGVPINDYVGRSLDVDAQPMQYKAYLKMEADEERMHMEYPGMEKQEAIDAFIAAYQQVLEGGDVSQTARSLKEQWDKLFE